MTVYKATAVIHHDYGNGFGHEEILDETWANTEAEATEQIRYMISNLSDEQKKVVEVRVQKKSM